MQYNAPSPRVSGVAARRDASRQNGTWSGAGCPTLNETLPNTRTTTKNDIRTTRVPIGSAINLGLIRERPASLGFVGFTFGLFTFFLVGIRIIGLRIVGLLLVRRLGRANLPTDLKLDFLPLVRILF